MTIEKDEFQEIILTRLMRLNASIYGIVAGILLGSLLFVATNWLVLRGGTVIENGEVVVGPHLSLLNQFFIGYEVTFAGSFIGLLYGLLSGFVLGYLMASLYNVLVSFKERQAIKLSRSLAQEARATKHIRARSPQS